MDKLKMSQKAVTKKHEVTLKRHIEGGLKTALIRLLKDFFDCLAAIIFTASLILTLSCIYIGLREKISGKMTFLAGYKLVYIESGSMEPTIKTGSFMVLKKADFEDIEEGDVITFETDSGYVTHRFTGLDKEAKKEGKSAYLITKGDANNIEDIERLDPENIRGVVIGLDK